jgi:hypothetical protein
MAAEVSKEQRATRRRALGRQLMNKSSNLAVDIAAVQGSTDLQYLTPKEAQRVQKLLKAMETVRSEFNKMSQHLENSE